MDLKEFGKLLKEERLRQNLDLSDVMDKTKISRVSLEAIEEGDERALPHPVYAKGFVKNYARFLGLDADKMGNTMAQIYSPKEESADHKEQLVLVDARKLPAVSSAWPRQVIVWGVAGLLVIFLAVGIWLMRSTIQDTFLSLLGKTGIWSQPAPETAPDDQLARLDAAARLDTEDSLAPEWTPTAPLVLEPPDHAPSPLSLRMSIPPGEDPAAAADLTSAFDAQGVQPALEGDAPEVLDATPAVDDPAVPSAAQQAREHEPQAPAASLPGERTLEIRAFQNCWLSVQADAGREREAFLRPGERFVASFEQSLDLKLGNAGGVELFLDGRPWPLRALPGEVMILRFP